MTHQHNSNGREWLMVEVPSEATDVMLIRATGELRYNEPLPAVIPDRYVMLPDGYSIHSDSLTITEEQAGEIVRQVGDMYEDYEYPEDLYVRAVRSYRSLLRSKQINSRVINLVRI